MKDENKTQPSNSCEIKSRKDWSLISNINQERVTRTNQEEIGRYKRCGEKRREIGTSWSQSTSCCSLKLRSFPVLRKWAPSTAPVALKVQHEPHIPCYISTRLSWMILFVKKSVAKIKNTTANRPFFDILHVTQCLSRKCQINLH